MLKLIRDCALYAFCWACWHVFRNGPWFIMKGRFGFAILPYAGMYAHCETWADFRACVQWNADGRPGFEELH